MMQHLPLFSMFFFVVSGYGTGSFINCATTSPGHGTSSSDQGFTLAVRDSGNNPVSSFSPGAPYTLVLTGSNQALKGFLFFFSSAAGGAVAPESGDLTARAAVGCAAGFSAVTHVDGSVKTSARAAWTAPTGLAAGTQVTLSAVAVGNQKTNWQSLSVQLVAAAPPASATGTGSPSPSPSATPTGSPTQTGTRSGTGTPPPTPSSTISGTLSGSGSGTVTTSSTPSLSPGASPSHTSTVSQTPSVTGSCSPTATGTPSVSPTGTPTASLSPSPSGTATRTASASASASGARGGAPFQYTAELSHTLSLEWAVVVPSRRALGGGGARAAAAAEAPYLFVRLNCSVPGAWAAFAVASAPNTMAGLDAVVVQPAAAPAAVIQQATVGGGRSAAAVALVGAAAGSLLPALSSFTAGAAGGGWSATFARRLSAGEYPGALAIREGGAGSMITVAWGAPGAGTYMAGHNPNAKASIEVDFRTGAAAAAPRPSALRLYYAHGALMFVAWGLLLPAGAGAAAALQKIALHKRFGVAGWVVSAAAFALAVAATGQLDRPHFSSSAGAHAALGLFTFLAGFAQPLLAFVAPGAHKLVGRALVVAVAPATIFLGLAAPLLELPVALIAAYAAVLALTVGALAWGARGLPCAARGSPVSTKDAAGDPASAGGAWVVNPCPRGAA